MNPRDLPKAPDSASRADQIGVLDPAAEDHLARTFGPRIYVMALARTGDPDAAQDLSQSTLVEILLALRKGQLRDREKLAGFVWGTTRNVINYYLRGRSQAPRSEPLRDDTPGTNRAPGHALETEERLALVRRAVARLDSADRQILRMTLIDGWEPAEIASRLGLSSEVVRQRKSRAIKRVIEVIKDLSRSQGGTPLDVDE